MLLCTHINMHVQSFYGKHLVCLERRGDGKASRSIAIHNVHQFLFFDSGWGREGGGLLAWHIIPLWANRALHFTSISCLSDEVLAAGISPIMMARPLGSQARYCPGTMRRHADLPNVSMCTRSNTFLSGLYSSTHILNVIMVTTLSIYISYIYVCVCINSTLSI